MAKRFYITTAISYPNGAPHIGHAYELIACDVLARFKRLDGFDVYFLTGTDEHGLKMLQTARKKNVAVEDLAEQNAAIFVEMGKLFNSSVDDFIRTSQQRHHQASQAIWNKMLENGDIYKDVYEGWYSMRDEAYYDEEETTLDEKGTRLGKQGTPVEWIEEESYFFRLSKYGERLLKFYEDNPNFIAPPHRLNEAVQFIKGGLKDLSISRNSFDWGVKVPGDESHVMYVWVDALTNYLTALGFPNSDEKWRFWPADLHVVGKDIMRFHTVFWPAFLMSAGLEIPKRVFGHGFLFHKAKKMSKSIGNVVDPFEIAGEYGVDAIRYFLLREVPFGQDGSYSHDAIVGRINADLANDLGNLAQRSLSMIFKNCAGELSAPDKNLLTEVDVAILKQNNELLSKVRSEIDVQNLHLALFAIWQAIADVNRYFTEQAPWSLKDSDFERMKIILYVAIETLRQFGLLLQPFIPTSAEKLLDLLQIEQGKRAFEFFEESLQKIKLVEAPQVIFPRYVNNIDASASDDGEGDDA